MIWFQEQFFFANRDVVYRVKDLAHSDGEPEKIFETPADQGLLFPKFFAVDDTLYLYLKQKLYRFGKKRVLFREKYGFEKLYDFDGYEVWDFVAVDDHRVAFQTRPRYAGQEEIGELTVLDLKTFQETKYPARYGYVRKWNGRVCVIHFGNPVKNVPILECFDLETGQKRVLMYGALGKECVREIYETGYGTVLLDYKENLYRVEDLWGQMKEVRL